MLSESLAQVQASESISSTSMRYMAENIQFSRMKNAIYPQASSQFYGYGFNGTAGGIPLPIDSELNTYDGSFYMDSSLHDQQGVFAIRSESPTVNHQSVSLSGPPSLTTIKRLDCPSFGANHLITKATMPTYHINVKQQQQSLVERIPGQRNETGTISNARKRPIENVDVTIKRNPEIVAGNLPSQSEWTTNKKAAMCFQEKLQGHRLPKEIKEVQRDRVPVRRSQKLADKITALQKLVSPYGKTDTASVLHEASVFIKVLQDQIENTIQCSRNTSMDNEYLHSKITGERQFSLQSKGFCLVPVSLTQNLIKEDPFNPYSTTNILPLQNTL